MTMSRTVIDIADLEQAEHFVLESEPEPIHHESPTTPAKHTVSKKFEIKDGARKHVTQFVLYEEGVLDFNETRRGNLIKAHRLMLRYLDSVPTIVTHTAKRYFQIALGLGGAAVLALGLAQFESLAGYALPAAIVAAFAAVAAVLIGAYTSHQRIVFETLHGRSPALRLHAGFGVRRRYHAILPLLTEAIEAASQDIGSDTAVFLRQEMREHYRLRGDGVLTPEDCDTGTCRILQQFDGPL